MERMRAQGSLPGEVIGEKPMEGSGQHGGPTGGWSSARHLRAAGGGRRNGGNNVFHGKEVPNHCDEPDPSECYSRHQELAAPAEPTGEGKVRAVMLGACRFEDNVGGSRRLPQSAVILSAVGS